MCILTSSDIPLQALPVVSDPVLCQVLQGRGTFLPELQPGPVHLQARVKQQLSPAEMSNKKHR